MKTAFYDKLVIATVWPLMVLLACAGTFVIARGRSRNYRMTGPSLKQNLVSVVLFVVFFVYCAVSFTTLQTFVCDSLDDGKAYLRADYSITCHTDTYTAYKRYASFMVCIYPVGIPAVFAWWLVRNRRELQKPGREAKADLQSFRFLWAGYKPSCYYFEVVECGRRIVLTGPAVFGLPNTAELVAIVLLLLAVVFLFVSESLSPFESKLDMWLYRWGNGIILASMYVALLLKFDFAMEGSQSSSAITALLIVANMFMIVTVAVQAVLLVKGLYVSNVQEQCARKRTPSNTRLAQAAEAEGFAVELGMSSINDQRKKVG